MQRDRKIRQLIRKRNEFYQRALKTATLSDMPPGGGDPSFSRVEDLVMQLMEWEESIGVDITIYDKKEEESK